MLSFRQIIQYDPDIGHSYVPGSRARIPHENGGYLVQVNQAGFRSDREFATRRRPGAFRALVFGDSVTAGQPISNKERYSDRLEALIPDSEVYNLGLEGTGTDQQYLIFRRFAPQYEHDLIIIGVFLENIRRVVAHYRFYRDRFKALMGADISDERHIFAKPYFTLGAEGELVLHNSPVPKKPFTESELPPDERGAVDHGGPLEWLRESVVRLGLRDVVQKVTGYQPLPAYDNSNSPGWQILKAILTSWIRESAQPVLVCPIPVYQHLEETADPKGYQQRFQELEKETGAIVHDPLADFLQLPMSERRSFRYKTDLHPSAGFHRVLAESLARRVRPLVAERGTLCR